jgi:hypothetical protein
MTVEKSALLDTSLRRQQGKSSRVTATEWVIIHRRRSGAGLLDELLHPVLRKSSDYQASAPTQIL